MPPCAITPPAELVRIWDADVIDAGTRRSRKPGLRYLDGAPAPGQGRWVSVCWDSRSSFTLPKVGRRAIARRRHWTDPGITTVSAAPPTSDRTEPISRSASKGELARARVSRGQQKLIAAAMLLGQLAVRRGARLIDGGAACRRPGRRARRQQPGPPTARNPRPAAATLRHGAGPGDIPPWRASTRRKVPRGTRRTDPSDIILCPLRAGFP